MTKRVFLLIITFAGLALAANCYANYSIKLKNGTVFVTDKYRIENKFIKFSYLNGKISIARERIKAITTSDAPVVRELDQTQSPINEVTQFKSALKQNNKEMLIQREKFRLAKKHSRETAKNKAWKRLSNLKQERKALQEEILEAYSGVLPDWWYEILNEKQFHVITENNNTSGY